jgi:hypothetical protein
MSDYKPNQFGSLLTFREGVTEKEVREALKKIAHLCEREPRVEHFDNRWGSPTFYIP